jgi:hypothetical protein
VAIIGEAHIQIRADTDKIRDDIRNGFRGAQADAERAGRESGSAFSRGFLNGGKSKTGGLFSKKFEGEAEAARKKLQGLIVLGNFLGPAITGAAGAISALGGGLVSLGAAAAQAGPALMVLPGAFAALIQSAITLKLAFSGVGAAISAGMKVPGGGAAKVKKDAKQVEEALNKVAEARRKLQKVINDNAQKRQDAIEDALDAQDGINDAIYAAGTADRDYAKAQMKTRDAVAALSQARREATEDLQQLRFETEGSVLSEKRAELQLEKTRETLQRVQDLPPNSRARKEAELAFAEADLNLRRAVDRSGDLKKEEDAASKAGVEGSKKVIDAQNDISKAKNDEQDALRDVLEAQNEVTKARLEASRASRNVGRVEKENAQDQRDAANELRDALKDVVDEREKMYKKAGGGGGSDPFAAAMAKLSAEAQTFVRYIISIQDEFKKLKAAAGQELFPKLEVAVRSLVANLFPVLIPLLKGTGGAIGDVAIKLADTITSADNLSRLESVWKMGDVLIRAFGDAASNLYETFLILLQAAGPLLERFANWVVTLTSGWKATARLGEQTGSLTEMFNRAGDVAAQLGRIFSNTFGALKTALSAAVGPGSGGEYMLNWFESASERFKEFANIGASNGGLKKYFLDASINASIVLQLLGGLVGIFAKLGAQAEVGAAAEILKGLIPIIENIALNMNAVLPSFAHLAVTIGKIVEIFSENQSLNVFFDVLRRIADMILKIVDSDIARAIMPYAGAFLAAAAAINFAAGALMFFGKAMLGNVIRLIGGPVIAALMKLKLSMRDLYYNMKAMNISVGQFGTATTAAVTKFQAGMAAMKFAIASTGIGLAIIAITTAVTAFAMAQMNAQAATDALVDSMDKEAGAFTAESIQLVTDALNADVTKKQEWIGITKLTGLSAREAAEAILEGGAALDNVNARIKEGLELNFKQFQAGEITRGQFIQTRDGLDGLSSSIVNQGEVTDDAREKTESARIQQEAYNKVKGEAADRAKKLGISIEIATRQIEAETRATKLASEAQTVLEARTEAVNDAISGLQDVLSKDKARITFLDFLDDIKKKLKGLPKNFDEAKQGGKDARLALQDEVSEALAAAQAMGGTSEQIAANSAKAVAGVIGKFKENGFKQKDIDEVLRPLKLMPSQLGDSLKAAADAAEAKTRADFKVTGQAAADGLAAGLEDPVSQKKVKVAVTKLANIAKSEFKKETKITSPSKVFAQFGAYIVDGLSEGIDKRSEKAIDAITRLVDGITKNGGDKLKEFGDKTKDRLTEFVGDLAMIGKSVADMAQGFDEAINPEKMFDPSAFATPLLEATGAVDFAKGKLDDLAKALSSKGVLKNKEEVNAGFMEVAANLRVNLVAALDKAKSKLEEVKSNFENFKSSIDSALRSGFDLSGAMSESAKEGGTSFVDTMAQQASKVTVFADKVNALIAAGFSMNSIGPVLSAGVNGGTEMAQALLEGQTTTLAADKTMETTLATLNEKLAAAGKAAFFQKGEDEAIANITAIEGMMTAQTGPDSLLMKTMNKLAKKLARDVKIGVSLSKSKFDVVIDVTRRIVDGIIPSTTAPPIPRGATGGIVNRPTYALIGEAGPEAVIPLNQTAGNGPLPRGLGFGSNVNITVNPSAGMDEVALASLVSREISFMMRKGSL